MLWKSERSIAALSEVLTLDAGPLPPRKKAVVNSPRSPYQRMGKSAACSGSLPISEVVVLYVGSWALAAPAFVCL